MVMVRLQRSQKTEARIHMKEIKSRNPELTTSWFRKRLLTSSIMLGSRTLPSRKAPTTEWSTSTFSSTLSFAALVTTGVPLTSYLMKYSRESSGPQSVASSPSTPAVPASKKKFEPKKFSTHPRWSSDADSGRRRRLFPDHN